MRPSVLLALALVPVFVGAIGCQSKTEPASSAPSAATDSKMAPMAFTAPPATGGVIGVAACDEYLNKWESCLATKITGDAREQVKVALDATRDAWKRAVATPEGKAGLATACEQAAELAKMQVSAYGCSW
jgi:hypothetical protein